MAIVGEAHIVVKAITTGFQRDVENSLKGISGSVKNIGEEVGKDFHKSVSKGMGGSGNKSPFGAFIKEADAAKAKFNGLIRTSYLMGPAISGAVSSMADLAAGLFAVGSAVGAAAPALAVLPVLLSAVAQAGIVAKLAFAGVGKAISALTKQKTGGGGAGAAAAARSKAIADANKALARAYQDAADQMYDADLKVARAQNDLTLAFAKGKEELQQLGFSAEEAALSEEKAGLQLERAREALRRVQDLPPNSRARRDAELAFKEADLNYREAKDKVNDLAKEQAYAAQTGVEGTKGVIDAQQALNDATNDQARTQRDNAQRIADAQENLQTALKKTSSAASGVASAMAGLPKSAQDFARHIADLKPKFDELRAAAADGLFPGLTRAVDNLVRDLFPSFKKIIGDTAGVIGDFADKFSRMLGDNVGIIDRVFGGANVKILENLGDAFIAVADGALNILDAVAPLAVKFSEWIKQVTTAWDETMKLKNANGELAGTFEKAADAAKHIFDMIKSAWGAIKEFGKAAAPAGIMIVDALKGAFDKMKAFGEAGNKTGELPNKFKDIAKNVMSMGHFLGQVAAVLFDLAGNPGVKKFWDTLSDRNVAGTFGDIAKKLAGSGPIIANFIADLAELISKFAETGGLENFFTILDGAVKVVSKIFDNKVVMDAFKFLAAAHGIALAFGTIGKVGGFAFKILFSKLTALPGLAAAAGPKFLDLAVSMETFRKGGLGGLKTSLSEARLGFMLLAEEVGLALAPFALIIAAVVAVIAVFALMYNNSKILRDSIKTLADAVMGALGDAFKTINDAIHEVMPSLNGISDVFKKMGDFVGTYIVPILQFVLVNAIHAFADAIALAIRIIKGLWDIFTKSPMEGLKEIFGALGTFFHDRITGIFKDAKAALGKIPLFDHLISGAKGAFNGVADAWNNTIGKFSITIPTWVPKYGGKGWDMPNMPHLAMGGVVRPTPGGTIARIAEAGRAERVEPLDSNGLSARDRAIINEFIIASGGGRSGGTDQTFNIFPSQGMDEKEIANLVSRKVAWNMRIGA